MTLRLSPRPDTDHYQLIDHFSVTVPGLGDVMVPRGFHYDGASVPPVAWQAIYSPFAPDVMRAAVVHDWLYHAHEDDAGDDQRRAADDALYEVLKQDKVSSFKCSVIWSAVRSFGGPYWENDAPTRAFLKGLYQENKNEPNIDKCRFPSWAKQ